MHIPPHAETGHPDGYTSHRPFDANVETDYAFRRQPVQSHLNPCGVPRAATALPSSSRQPSCIPPPFPQPATLQPTSPVDRHARSLDPPAAKKARPSMPDPTSPSFLIQQQIAALQQQLSDRKRQHDTRHRLGLRPAPLTISNSKTPSLQLSDPLYDSRRQTNRDYSNTIHRHRTSLLHLHLCTAQRPATRYTATLRHPPSEAAIPLWRHRLLPWYAPLCGASDPPPLNPPNFNQAPSQGHSVMVRSTTATFSRQQLGANISYTRIVQSVGSRRSLDTCHRGTCHPRRYVLLSHQSQN